MDGKNNLKAEFYEVKNMKVVTLERLKQFNTLMMAKINNPDSESYPNNDWLQMVYPVGSIYMSTSNIPPIELFRFGTWEQIKDTFLLCAGDSYSAGSIGGESEHILTVDEMPSHNHTFNRHQLWRTEEVPEAGTSDGYGANNKMLSVYLDNTSMVGGGQSHNNMPPYLAVYVWKRTA